MKPYFMLLALLGGMAIGQGADRPCNAAEAGRPCYNDRGVCVQNCDGPVAMGQDVPAIKVGSHLAAICGGKYDSVAVCMDGQVDDYSCADKSNVLLTAEDGKKWCHAPQATSGTVIPASIISAPYLYDASTESIEKQIEELCTESITLRKTTKRISDLFPEECSSAKPAKEK
jgi:hypothetical protein